MPGVIMDNASIEGAKQEPGSYEFKNGFPSPYEGADKAESSDLRNGLPYANGISADLDDLKQNPGASFAAHPPPGLVHITQGFFPFSQLANRSAQQCWNDLSELVTALAEIQIAPQEQSLSLSANGKFAGNQSSGNVQKKLRMLDFAHAKRGEFIKLLVLSQWSRQATDVSRLIDLQGFIRTCHQAYGGALQWVGDMKRDLVRAQVANPDLRTALEVLSTGKVAAMSDLGYKPPKPLTTKRTLKKLQKLNRIISVRLALYDQVPHAFQTYCVHDGRVTFSVPGEFELDLSVGEASQTSQFFFVDIRFIFSPSSNVPKGRVLNELDIRVNDVLRDSGLTGCFNLLHNLILTNKVNIIFKQAAELARGLWSEALRVELLHRTLIVQYWVLKPGAKSWIEIGVKGGRRGGPGLPYLSLRWMRDGQEVEDADIEFDTECLSMECILRSVIAQHVSYILSSVYTNISKDTLFSTGKLSLRAQLSRTEPGDCQLNVQLTAARHLRATVEPMSGTSVLSAIPGILDRSDSERIPDKSVSDDMVSRIMRIRCFSAIEEIESNMRMLDFETVNPRSLKVDVRKVFPSNIIRFSFFWHNNWERNWIMAATSSMDCDNWWIIQLQPTLPTEKLSSIGAQNTSMLRSAQVISNEFFTAQQRNSYASFADLGHCLTGVLAIHANARFLAESQCFNSYPPLHKLQIDPGFRTPDIFIRYEPSSLPPAMRVSPPLKLKKPYINDTIRLGFHGIDPYENLAIIVAYGSLSIPAKSFIPLISKWDRSLVFKQKGNGFAIRLLAPAGQAVITNLVQCLQKLDRVLFIVESLQRKKMEVRYISLSRITYAYGPGKDLCANIDVNVSAPSSYTDIDYVAAASKSESLFPLRLGITFDHPNPHRRVQESLTASLNNASTDANLDSFFGLLLLTLPLLRAFDRISANTSRNEPLKVQIIARNALTFQIHYPIAKFRFRLIAGQHLNRMTWILRTVSGIEGRQPQDELVNRIQEKLYRSKGDGWKGLGNGAVANVEKVLNLILELDGCFSDVQDKTPVTNPLGEFGHGVSNDDGLEQAQKASMPIPPNESAAGNPKGNHEHRADDIIMID